MTDLEDLIRDALAPTATATATDPVGALARRVRRARRRLAVGAGVAAAVVAAAVVVPLAALGGNGVSNGHLGVANSPSTGPTPTAKTAVPDVWMQDVIAVASGDDGSPNEAVWAMGGSDPVNSATLMKLDPVTGKVLRRVTVPGPVDFLTVGLGYVWAYGGGDGGYGNLSVIDRVDPASGKVHTLRIHGKGAPYSMVFTAQGAYVSLAVRDEVVRVSGVGGRLGLYLPVHVPGQPTNMVVTGDGNVWVQESLRHKWAELDVADGRSKLVHTYSWNGPVSAFSHDNTVWTSDSKTRVVEITPSYLSSGVSVAYGNRVPTVGRPVGVVEEADGGGIYVATADPSAADVVSDRSGISYYSPEAVNAGSRQPTYELPNIDVQSIAADPDAGVAFITSDGTLEHWNPLG
jgi:hypothetical protein